MFWHIMCVYNAAPFFEEKSAFLLNGELLLIFDNSNFLIIDFFPDVSHDPAMNCHALCLAIVRMTDLFSAKTIG